MAADIPANTQRRPGLGPVRLVLSDDLPILTPAQFATKLRETN